MQSFATADIDSNSGPVGEFDGCHPYDAMITGIGWETFACVDNMLSERYGWDDVEAVFQHWHHKA